MYGQLLRLYHLIIQNEHFLSLIEIGTIGILVCLIALKNHTYNMNLNLEIIYFLFQENESDINKFCKYFSTCIQGQQSFMFTLFF